MYCLNMFESISHKDFYGEFSGSKFFDDDITDNAVQQTVATLIFKALKNARIFTSISFQIDGVQLFEIMTDLHDTFGITRYPAALDGRYNETDEESKIPLNLKNIKLELARTATLIKEKGWN